MKAELYHDILAKKIYEKGSPEEKMRLRVQSFIKNRHQYYISQGVLLSKEDLDYINPYIDIVEITQEEKRLVEESRKAVTRRARRQLFIAAVIIAVLMMLLAMALWQWQEAKAKKNEAVKQKKIADDLKTEALKLAENLKSVNKDLVKAKDDAEQNALKAQEAEKRAMLNEGIAVRNAILAQRAEAKAIDQRDLAERKAVAYRLLVAAVEEQANDNHKDAFLLCKKAHQIYSDEAVNAFFRNAYNQLIQKEKSQTLNITGNLRKAHFVDTAQLFTISDKAVNLLHITDSNQSYKISGRSIQDAAITPDLQSIAIADGKKVRISEHPFRVDKTTFSHPTVVKNVRFLAGQEQMLLTTAGNTARLWLDGTLRPVKEVVHEKSITSLDINGRKVLTADESGIAKIWHAGSSASQSIDFKEEIQYAAFSPDGSKIIVSLINHEIKLYDLNLQKTIATVNHRANVNALLISTPWFLSISNDESAKKWDYRGNLLRHYNHEIGANDWAFVQEAALHPISGECLTATQRNEVFLWHPDGFIIADYDFGQEIRDLDYSSNGESFAVAFEDKIQLFPSYFFIETKLGNLNWIQIDQLGYEAPLYYWLEEENSQLLKAYANHLHQKFDNFKTPEQLETILNNATQVYAKWVQKKGESQLSSQDRETIADAYGSLSWSQLQTRDFEAAILNARKGIRMNPSKKWIYTNLALGYVLTGRYAQAVPIYQELKNLRFDENEREKRTFKALFLEDLDKLEQLGIVHNDFDKVRALLK